MTLRTASLAIVLFLTACGAASTPALQRTSRTSEGRDEQRDSEAADRAQDDEGFTEDSEVRSAPPVVDEGESVGAAPSDERASCTRGAVWCQGGTSRVCATAADGCNECTCARGGGDRQLLQPHAEFPR